MPRYKCNSYELSSAAVDADWTTPFAGFLVGGELQESINELNAWRGHLESLPIWLTVLNSYSEEDAWSLQHHFVNPLARYCMLQPSTTRDRLVRVATNGIHQVNLSVDAGYKDALVQDKLKPGQFLSRKRAEEQLCRLVGHFELGAPLVNALYALDSDSYRRKTFDYRNEASHFIAPRLGFGEVQLVRRQMRPSKQLERGENGIAWLIENPRKLCVSYGFGGIPPLALSEMITINEEQYRAAVAVLSAYSDLLRAVIPLMAERQKERSQQLEARALGNGSAAERGGTP